MIPISELMSGFSVEMTGKDASALRAMQAFLPSGARVNVAYLGNESVEQRIAAAGAVKEAGFVPVPHIAARRLATHGELAELLKALNDNGAGDHILVIAGDPGMPEGPYADALALIETAPLDEHGVQTVSVSGYPDGHPGISTGGLWAALETKASVLVRQGRGGDIITQFCFDVDPLIGWIEQVRSRGIELPIRVGVPGPAGTRRLLSYAARFGVATSARIARKYGFSLANLLGTTGPDRFLTDLARRLDPDRHGVVGLHFYTFGGLGSTAQWIRDFQRASP